MAVKLTRQDGKWDGPYDSIDDIDLLLYLFLFSTGESMNSK